MECQKYEVLVASKSQILRNKTNDTIIVSFATGKYYGHHRITLVQYSRCHDGDAGIYRRYI
jgi:hypothetical protein